VDWNGDLNVRAFVSDNVGVSEVKINGKIAQENGTYYYVNALHTGGRIYVEAWDVNSIKAEVNISVPTAS